MIHWKRIFNYYLYESNSCVLDCYDQEIDFICFSFFMWHWNIIDDIHCYHLISFVESYIRACGRLFMIYKVSVLFFIHKCMFCQMCALWYVYYYVPTKYLVYNIKWNNLNFNFMFDWEWVCHYLIMHSIYFWPFIFFLYACVHRSTYIYIYTYKKLNIYSLSHNALLLSRVEFYA